MRQPSKPLQRPGCAGRRALSRPFGDTPVRHAGSEAELPYGIVVAKAWDDAKDDGNS
jgi:hypothetical protein